MASTFSRLTRLHLQLLRLGTDPLGRPGALAPGKYTLVFDFKYDGPGLVKGGPGVLSVDGKEVATKKVSHTIPSLLTDDETFDVGLDTRTPVHSVGSANWEQKCDRRPQLPI